MSSFSDRYIELFDLETFLMIQGRLICKGVIFTQGDPALDTPENVHIALKSMPIEAYSDLYESVVNEV